MKKDFKKDFLRLSKKNNKDIKNALRFYPKEKFLINILKENHKLIAVNKELKSSKSYENAFAEAEEIMLRFDDWLFDGRFYVKTINEPEILSKNTKPLKDKKISFHYFDFVCGDLYLRNKVDSNIDTLYSYKTIVKYFKNLKKIKIDKFRWSMQYSYPNEDQKDHLKNSQKLGHNLSLNLLEYNPISYNQFNTLGKYGYHYGSPKNTLHISVNLLNQPVEPLLNFIKKLNNLKRIEFNDSIVIDRDHTFNSSYQTDEFRNRYRENLDNFSFLNPYCNDWEFGKNNNQDKKIMENLIKIRKSVNRKVVFYFNSIDFYSTPVQEMLKEKKIIDKIIDFKGIYY